MAALQSPHSISRFHKIITPTHPQLYTKNKDFNPLIFNFSNFGDQKRRKKSNWKAHGEKKLIMQPPTIFIPTWPVDHPHSHTHGRYEEFRPSQFSLKKKLNWKYKFSNEKTKGNKTNKKIILFFCLQLFFLFTIIILSRMAGYFFKYLLNGKCDVFFFNGSGFGIFISGFLWIEWFFPYPPLLDPSPLKLVVCDPCWYFISCAISFRKSETKIVQSSSSSYPNFLATL
jgi:hypothetical protein